MSVREAWATAWLITCTAWAVLVVSGDSDVFQCLSPAGENSSVRSCLHGVLCPVGPAGLCDGRSADCPGGRDEARGLCEDPRWSGLPCPLRCDGGRPGQCLGTRALRCDGVYHCADRSDESGCAGLGGDRDLFGKTDYEEVAESAGLWALVFLVVGQFFVMVKVMKVDQCYQMVSLDTVLIFGNKNAIKTIWCQFFFTVGYLFKVDS